MLFNSLHFFVFFPAIVFLYFAIPHRYRWALLLAGSVYFYMVLIPRYILVLATLILIDYSVGIILEKTEGRKKKWFLVVSLLSNIGMLFFFKYFNFFTANITAIAEAVGWNYSIRTLSIVLPIGLSFHTFQSMSYIIEVYRGRYPAERHLGIYAAYVMFFPQLVAGPIERPYNLLHQFYEEHRVSFERIGAGLRRMLWGFFKKIVIADNLARIVDHVYNYPTQFDGIPLILATIFFAFQLYADFSGYSDIAIGSANVLGFTLMNNFDRPYASKSIGEFWQRWHISLSSWFRDYVYIPLGGNRVSRSRWYANIMMVFLLSGLWHGANWTFVLWGGINGAYIVASSVTSSLRERLIRRIRFDRFPNILSAFRMGVTFLFVALAFLFFRARSLGDAWYMLTHLFGGGEFRIGQLGVAPFDFINVVLAIVCMVVVEYIERGAPVGERLARRPPWIRWTAYNALMLWILFFGYFGEQPFIYFQF